MPGGVTKGFYAGAGWQDLAARADDPEVAAWIKSYTEATGEKFPGTGALLGRSAAELFVKGLEAAGPDLSTDSFVAALESLEFEDKIAGNTVSVGKNHVASNKVFISKIVDGGWQVVGAR